MIFQLKEENHISKEPQCELNEKYRRKKRFTQLLA